MSEFLTEAIAEVNGRIGPDPEGEPSDLLRYAQQIDGHAEQLNALATRSEEMIAAGGLQSGPYATRTKNHGREIAEHLRVRANDAKQVAELVRRDAEHLRATRANWQAQVQSTLRRLEAQASGVAS